MSTSTEQKQVLEMLAEGKITPDEAQRLLERLARSGPSDDHTDTSATASSREASSGHRAATMIMARPEADHRDGDGKGPRRNLRWLRVVVDTKDGEKVNIRIPLQLLRTGIKLSAMIPSQARERMKEEGLDLSHLSQLGDEDLIQALEEFTVDVDSEDGDKVRIYCE